MVGSCWEATVQNHRAQDSASDEDIHKRPNREGFLTVPGLYDGIKKRQRFLETSPRLLLECLHYFDLAALELSRKIQCRM